MKKEIILYQKKKDECEYKLCTSLILHERIFGLSFIILWFCIICTISQLERGVIIHHLNKISTHLNTIEYPKINVPYIWGIEWLLTLITSGIEMISIYTLLLLRNTCHLFECMIIHCFHIFIISLGCIGILSTMCVMKLYRCNVNINYFGIQISNPH